MSFITNHCGHKLEGGFIHTKHILGAQTITILCCACSREAFRTGCTDMNIPNCQGTRLSEYLANRWQLETRWGSGETSYGEF